jgi:hypothetical protein
MQTHEHTAHDRRHLTLRDGTERTVETCECGAVRTVDLPPYIVPEGKTFWPFPQPVASAWHLRESERAG